MNYQAIEQYALIDCNKENSKIKICRGSIVAFIGKIKF